MKCEYNAEQLSALVEKQIGIYWNFRGGGYTVCYAQSFRPSGKELKQLEF